MFTVLLHGLHALPEHEGLTSTTPDFGPANWATTDDICLIITPGTTTGSDSFNCNFCTTVVGANLSGSLHFTGRRPSSWKLLACGEPCNQFSLISRRRRVLHLRATMILQYSEYTGVRTRVRTRVRTYVRTYTCWLSPARQPDTARHTAFQNK